MARKFTVERYRWKSKRFVSDGAVEKFMNNHSGCKVVWNGVGFTVFYLVQEN